MSTESSDTKLAGHSATVKYERQLTEENLQELADLVGQASSLRGIIDSLRDARGIVQSIREARGIVDSMRGASAS